MMIQHDATGAGTAARVATRVTTSTFSLIATV